MNLTSQLSSTKVEHEIDDMNKVTDILIESVYSGSDTTIWKEFLLPDRPMGTPDNAHPNENGHRKIYQILKENLKRKLKLMSSLKTLKMY